MSTDEPSTKSELKNNVLRKKSGAGHYVWQTSALWIMAAFVVAMSIYHHVTEKPWVWRTHISRRAPAVKLYIPPALQHVELYFAVNEEVRFAIAKSDAAVRAFWRAKTNDETTTDSVIACSTLEETKPAPKNPDLSRFVKCTLNGAKLTIDLQAHTPAKKPDDKEDPKPQAPPQDLWLIPYHHSDLIGKYTVTGLDWTSVTLGTPPSSSNQVSPSECVDQSERDIKTKCTAADMVLGTPLLERSDDLKSSIARDAVHYERKLSPYVFRFMYGINFLLLGGLGITSVLSWVGVGLPWSRPSSKGLLLEADRAWRGFRRLLQWLETTGPAISFILTTLGLLLSFHSRATSNDEALFQEQIALAMTATFLGLTMRVLANSLDTLIAHLTHWHADADGIVVFTRPADVKGKDAEKKPLGTRIRLRIAAIVSPKNDSDPS